ncbi:MAG TPA: glycosyltransferase [Firmicutes bacterium]|nr:glycosyltransferase [Bacillota bacterium]
MKILWLLPVIPFPPDTGGKQDVFFMLREFSRMGNDITAGIIFHDENPPAVPDEFSRLVNDLFFIPGNPGKLHSRLLKTLTDDVPFKFRKYHSEESVRILADKIADGKFDTVICDHLHLAPLLLDTRPIVDFESVKFPKTVLRTPNVESVIVKKYADRVSNPMVAAFARRESEKMKKYESVVLSEFDLVAAISPVDKVTFEQLSKKSANIVSITAGVDTDELKPSSGPPIPGEVVFVGSFDWQPNVDGALWFIDKVWKKIRESFPEAHLSIVGRKPPPYLSEKASDSISVTGRVESVEDYVRRASCSIVPLWIGSGMRLKILEAFALGCPVVSTSLGAEGIEITDGEDILMRDDPAGFADAVLQVLTDINLRDRLAKNARMLVEQKYSWSKVANQFSDLIEMLPESGRGR